MFPTQEESHNKKRWEYVPAQKAICVEKKLNFCLEVGNPLHSLGEMLWYFSEEQPLNYVKSPAWVIHPITRDPHFHKEAGIHPKDHGHTGKSTAKGHEDDEGSGESHIWGKAERASTAQPREETAQEGVINVYKYLKGGWKEDRARLCSVVPSDRTRGSGHKLTHRVFPLNIRKHFFTVRVTDHWRRVPREVVEFPSLEIFKNSLDTVLGNQM